MYQNTKVHNSHWPKK